LKPIENKNKKPHNISVLVYQVISLLALFRCLVAPEDQETKRTQFEVLYSILIGKFTVVTMFLRATASCLLSAGTKDVYFM